jgi:hypothetical protein
MLPCRVPKPNSSKTLQAQCAAVFRIDHRNSTAYVLMYFENLIERFEWAETPNFTALFRLAPLA